MVIIQGFRSFRDKTDIGPLSSLHNAIVGRKGSGKSNIFHAIQFVLAGDEFSYLREDMRLAQLYEGTGPRVLSACVEVVFDNKDRRIPIAKDEVTMRREIGVNKDQYFLNTERVKRSDVIGMLETAGFTRSNPYYIVNQGMINQIATASDSQLIELLREVAGVTVYEDRREESIAILGLNDNGKEDNELFVALGALQEEKEEKEKWEMEKEVVTCVIRHKEATLAATGLKEMEEKRMRCSSDLCKLLDKQKETADEMKEKMEKVNGKLRMWTIEVQSKIEEKDPISDDIQGFLNTKAQLEFSMIKVKQEGVDDDTGSKYGNSFNNEDCEDCILKQQTVEGEIREQKVLRAQEQIDAIRPVYEEWKQREETAATQLSLNKQKYEELYAKLGRSEKFASRKERNEWIAKELWSLHKFISDNENEVEVLRRDLESDQSRLVTLERQIQEVTVAIETDRETMQQNVTESHNMKMARYGLQYDRKILWRKEIFMQEKMSALKEEVRSEEQALRSVTGKSVLNGIDGVQKVLRYFREKEQHPEVVEGYYGTLSENFTVDKEFYSAVEVTAGNSLFFHLVNTDHTATKIQEEFDRQRLPGGPTFMPLNKLNPTDKLYPLRRDVIPMIGRLTYEPRFACAMKEVFGQTLICRNLDVATEIARAQHFDCITMDGDLVSQRGASLTGGFRDPSTSKLDLLEGRTESLEELHEAEREYTEHKEELSNLGSRINKLVDDMEGRETENTKTKDSQSTKHADLRLKREQVQHVEASRARDQRSMAYLQSRLESQRATAQSLESEMGTDLLSQLSPEDQGEVDRLHDQIRTLTTSNKEALRERIKVETDLNKLEVLLKNNLHKKQAKSELERVEKRIEESYDQMTELDTAIGIGRHGQQVCSAILEKRKQVERLSLNAFRKATEELGRIEDKRKQYLRKQLACSKEIDKLGILAPAVYKQYNKISTKQLFKELDKCNKELEKYSHILSGFVLTASELFLDELKKRRDEQVRALAAILALMQHLDQRKDEAILLTFNQVAKNFTEIFKELVPQGHAILVMKRKDTGEEENEDVGAAIVDQFTGVGIKVSFTGSQANMSEMQQLSGGQKSLVALTLIFAIQKTDPAPFYLFDEIDAALDAKHRKAVAEWIQKSSDSQFITSTFRREILEHADQFYGVTYRNKMSHINCVDQGSALDFVNDNATHG